MKKTEKRLETFFAKNDENGAFGLTTFLGLESRSEKDKKNSQGKGP